MEMITKYKAFDGTEYLEESKCADHESNCKIADLIMINLPLKPDGFDFSNGSGYIQHDYNNLLNVRNEFLEFCKRYTDHRWIQETIDGVFDVDPSWAGRMIGECAPNYIYKMWYRFACIDKQQKEWGQPYFATNEQGENKRLN